MAIKLDEARVRLLKGAQVDLTTSGSVNPAFSESRTGGASIMFGVGSGKVNHGMYSNTLSKWIVYADDSKIYLNGNALTATKLATARAINGTNFDGSAAITTANWGTARTLTIGNTGKSVNGSGNVSWSLADIGALPLTGGTLTGDVYAPCYTTNKTISVAPDGTAEGWYRCATFTTGSGTSNNFILSIRRSYYSPENEGYLFSISNAYTSVNITQLSGSIGGHLLTKIRVNIDENHIIYVDYYMKSNGTASYKNGWYISGFGDGTVYTPYLVSSYTGTVTEFETVAGLKNSVGYIGNAATATTLANARTLSISSTPGTTGTSFNGSANATLIIPATVKTFTELGTNKLSSTSALYISPSSTLYLDSAASTSILFRPQGTERARFDTSGNFVIITTLRPGTDNTHNLGTASYRWKNIYGVTTTSNTYYAGTAATKGNIYLYASGDSSTVATYGRFYVSAVGSVGDGTNSVAGAAYLTLGNATASSTTTTAGLNNAYGVIRIYGTGTTYQNLRALNGSASRTSYLRDYGATGYLVATTGTSAVGSSTGPVYINSSGVATACGTSLAVSITGNAATATAIKTAGTTAQFYRGDLGWNNCLMQTEDKTITIDSNLKIGTARQDFNIITNNGSGSGVNDGYAGGITFGDPSKVYAGMYYQSSGSYGTRLIFATTNSYANGAYARMIIQSNGNVGIGTMSPSYKLQVNGEISASKVYGAVWNDYAEYRESDCKEFGRVLAEKGDDTLIKTTKRLQPFAGISSDTFGFAIGETEKAKTPIAIAGRVLVYTYRNRKEYKPGDVVCAAPNGTVDIMTREEIIKYPDRIVGTVSCVPEYETWGSGDRDPVKVGNRIWIKVK